MSTTFGSSSAAAQPGVRASSSSNSPIRGVATGPSSTFLPRSDGHASPLVPLSSSLAHRPQNSPPRPPSGVPQKREIIELDDSDTDNDAQKHKQRQPVSPSSSRGQHHRLQPPFDPIPRSAAGSSDSPKLNHASASPSIASLIHPEQPGKHSNQPPISPKIPETNGRFIEPKPDKSAKSNEITDSASRSPNSKAGTALSSKAPSPKIPPPQSRATVPTGNGLLGSVLPGMGAPSSEADPVVPNIALHVPLNGEINKYINFQKLAEERYGWAALNPKLAKAREQMMLDSGDEMMLDGSESESNVETGGAADSGVPKRKKAKTKADLYDKNDPFIDDSEMLWEEQAAASKDGFFVYSGPLVPVGEKPQIERADGTVKGARGRGRGRGRGTGAARGGATTAAPRKPRVTKKEKEKMEKEKEERERYAAIAAAASAPRAPTNH